MKKLIFPLLIGSIILFTACTSTDNAPKTDIADVLEEYKDCKDDADEKHSCQEYIAMAICGHFGINDFVNPDKEGDFVKYEKIPEIVADNGYWSKLGNASDKEVVLQAASLTNDDIPVLAINTAENYRHVCILLKGKGNVSTSWGGIEVPLCASFFPNKPDDSFIDNSLNYAFSKPAEVELWARR